MTLSEEAKDYLRENREIALGLPEPTKIFHCDPDGLGTNTIRPMQHLGIIKSKGCHQWMTTEEAHEFIEEELR